MLLQTTFSSNSHNFQGVRALECLSGLYKKLSDCLELVEDVFYLEQDQQRLAIAAVLEEDLEDLLEECEEYLIDGRELTLPAFSSFQSRSATVLEEVQEVIGCSPLRS